MQDTALLLQRLIHYSPDLKNRLQTNCTAVIKQQGVDTNYSWLGKEKAAEWEENNNKRHQRGSWQAEHVWGEPTSSAWLASSRGYATLPADCFYTPHRIKTFTVWHGSGSVFALDLFIVFWISSFKNDFRFISVMWRQPCLGLAHCMLGEVPAPYESEP